MQLDGQGILQPIAFYSRQMLAAEATKISMIRNYSLLFLALDNGGIFFKVLDLQHMP
jgi:hypothetical protein